MTTPFKMIKKTLTLLLLLNFSSCGLFTEKVESLASAEIENSKDQKRPNKKNLFCFKDNGISLLLEDDATIKYYQNFYPQLFESGSFSFIQKAVMLSLIEMSRRPDQASPSSRLQIYLRFKNMDYFFDFSAKESKQEALPFIKGTDFLLKTFDGPRTLMALAEKLDQTLPQSMSVSIQFEKFLQENKKGLAKNENLSSVFFKGDEVLTKHETFKRANLKKLIALYSSKNVSSDSLYDISKNNLSPIAMENKSTVVKCNADIIDEIPPKEETDQRQSHYFAMKDGSNVFVAVSSANILKKPYETIDSSYFFKSGPSPRPLPVCQLKNSQQDLVLFSTEGRYPAQHLKHLLAYDLAAADNFVILAELLNFSRHLFLDDPDRILYESKRGRRSQLDFFLSMNFPIYHVDNLGNIIGMAGFKSDNKEVRSLIVDDRNLAKIWCEK